MKQHRKLAAVGFFIGLSLVVGLLAIGWLGLDWGHTLFSQLCHQDSDRCLTIGGTPLAVCSRCTGVYVGITLGCFLWWQGLGAIGIRAKGIWGILALGLGMNFGDFVLEWIGFYSNAVWIRSLLGFVLGMAIALFVFFRCDTQSCSKENV